jgi:hypothetical protein
LEDLEDELGPLIHKLEKKLKEKRIDNKERKRVRLDSDEWFSEITEKIILPIMMKYKNFLESKKQGVSLNCNIQKSNQLHEGISFELKGSIPIAEYDAIRRITFFPKKYRIHILEEGTLGDGHPVELSYSQEELTHDFVRKKLTALIKEYINKLLISFK